MKGLALIIAIVALLQLVHAQPHDHQHFHDKRDEVFVTDYVTVTAPEVVVWVNGQGKTISIETRTPKAAPKTSTPGSVHSLLHTTTSTSTATTPLSSSSLVHANVALPPPAPKPTTSSTAHSTFTTVQGPPPQPSTSVKSTTSAPVSVQSPPPPAVVTTTAPARVAEPEVAPEAPLSSTLVPGSNQVKQPNSAQWAAGLGITYSPYNADTSCKSQAQVNSDFAALKGYSIVRVYGVDCNQVAKILVAAPGMKIFAGLVDLNNLAYNLGLLIAEAGSNWNAIDTVSIGNELINDGAASIGDVIAALGTARAILRPAGYHGFIVTVDTFDAILNNPALCQNSDYCAANCHAYFDPNVAAPGAGQYVYSQYSAIVRQFPEKAVVITESGWPHAGDANGIAVPSIANQQAAIASLRAAFDASLILFTAYDDLWKNPGSLGVERSFGIYGH